MPRNYRYKYGKYGKQAVRNDDRTFDLSSYIATEYLEDDAHGKEPPEARRKK